MKFGFYKKYFLYTVLLFITEVLIALYLHDRFVRPYVGDYLVVILIYCFVRSFVRMPVLPAAMAVLVFSYSIETLQYFNIVTILGLEDVKIARIVIGTGFSWWDLVAYTLGIATVVALEKRSRI